MKMRYGLIAATGLIGSVLSASSAQAAITINVAQVGTSVVATGTGSFNTAGLSVYSTTSVGTPGANVGNSVLRVGAAVPAATIFTGVKGPALGFVQGFKAASSATGDSFGLIGYMDAIGLPTNYRSGAALNGTATFNNATFTTLGLRVGQYVYSSAADTITINVGAASAAVPEPASWALMIGGVGLVGGTMRRRKANVRTAVAFA